ncbi:MAG: 3,4-dihydroxy-2-butanone-4-phosphate synthase, partial [Candidatus Dormibacteraeota bacterium]|nr:3,4-dihydroxy-2-butanone-4-phosphate synthase [Candidatus Dormibacteraeota bacterium]
MPLCTVEEAIADIRDGRFVIIVDDEDRENEGDLAIAADRVSPEAINFMATHARGLVCVSSEGWRLDELGLSAMVDTNTSRYGTAFTVSVDAVGHGVTTGISAYDRATTIRLLCDDHARPSDFAKPGHTFPLRAATGGVLERAGQTEAIVDLCKLAGRFPAGVICEIMREDGRMARRPDLDVFAAEHDVKIVAIDDIIAYRRRTER